MSDIFGENKFSVFDNFYTVFGSNTALSLEAANAIFGKFRIGLSGYFNAGNGDTSSNNKKAANIQKLLDL